MDKQVYCTSLQDKEVFPQLHDPNLANLFNMNPMNIVKPDQDIDATFDYVISRAHGPTLTYCNPLAIMYAPSSKLCGAITFKHQQILYHACTYAQQSCPQVHNPHNQALHKR